MQIDSFFKVFSHGDKHWKKEGSQIHYTLQVTSFIDFLTSSSSLLFTQGKNIGLICNILKYYSRINSDSNYKNDCSYK